MEKYALEVEKILSQLPKRTSAHHPETYIGGGESKLYFMGLTAPQLNQIMFHGFSFSEKKQEELALIWDGIWNDSHCYEVMLLALMWFYHKKQREILWNYWPILKQWAYKIDNWAHADTLSEIYARILEDKPTATYAQLKIWNRSSQPWLQRLSLVSLLCYSRQRKKILPVHKILPLVEAHLDSPHKYVQKAVGWTLRECGNVYANETLSFLKENIHHLSSSAFSAATEKIDAKIKNNLKKSRKLKIKT